jgi:hypothetical protein
LQQLNQILQQLGVNPNQISFADRIALLPLLNDPAAIQQYIQGLPTGAAVLSPATSQMLAPSPSPRSTSPSPDFASGSHPLSSLGANANQPGQNSANSANQSSGVAAASKPSPIASPDLSTQPEPTGNKVNISV